MSNYDIFQWFDSPIILFFSNFGSVIFETTVLILLALGLRRLLKNYSKKYVYYAWMLVALRGAFPVEFRTSSGIIVKTKEQLLEEAVNPQVPVMVRDCIAGIYLLGVVATLIFYILQFVRAKRAVKRAFNGIGKTKICKEIETPFVMGVIWPKIYLPEISDEDTLRCVIAHEKNHIEHGDHIIRFISIIALCVHWWNPLMWYAMKKLNEDLEMYSDEISIEKTETKDRQMYANVLLEFAKKQNGFQEQLSFGESVTEHRVKHIFEEKKHSFAVGLAVAVLLFGLTAVMFAEEKNYLETVTFSEAEIAELEDACRQDYLEQYGDVVTYDGQWNLEHICADEDSPGFCYAHFTYEYIESEYFFGYDTWERELRKREITYRVLVMPEVGEEQRRIVYVNSGRCPEPVETYRRPL